MKKGFFQEYIKETFEIIKQEIIAYKKYKKRICDICGKYVEKDEELISPSSFSIIHEKCLNKNDKN